MLLIALYHSLYRSLYHSFSDLRLTKGVEQQKNAAKTALWLIAKLGKWSG
ncbi:MAG: hypothetical protein P0Y65_14185 [Candidatus Devosia phytovorans]|uniref:Uncharacterized protein n=1 Tax=Candidatus Devosia phytovorans TaxID=3121372 RepID=A0AAJ6AZ20_9HYPH|nr:hypothetical protein [Devosia sp.]WEK03336.1 MAG: hypothetical protein P0Y65_14185 [Devosia sp.]